MSPIAIGLVVLACVTGGALFGMFLRTVTPARHLDDGSKDVLKLVTALLATLAALVLGLLVASARNSFDSVNEGFRQSAAKIVLLDRALAQYGPEAKEVRDLFKRTFASRLEQLFPKEKGGRVTLVSPEHTATIEGLQQQLRALSPQDDAQRALKARALELSDGIIEARWLGIAQEENSIPTPLLIVLVFWLAVMFASFGLFAPPNPIVIGALFLGAVSLSAAIFVIEELNNPLVGFVSISRAPMERAVGILGK